MPKVNSFRCFICGSSLHGFGLRVDAQNCIGTPVWWHEVVAMEPLVCGTRRSPRCYVTAINDPSAREALEHLQRVASRKFLA